MSRVDPLAGGMNREQVAALASRDGDSKRGTVELPRAVHDFQQRGCLLGFAGDRNGVARELQGCQPGWRHEQLGDVVQSIEIFLGAQAKAVQGLRAIPCYCNLAIEIDGPARFGLELVDLVVEEG